MAQQGKKWLIIVNSTEAENQYASLVVAFVLTSVHKAEVTVFYGARGVPMAKKEALRKLEIPDEVKEVIAFQIPGLSPSALPPNLELLVKYLNKELGVKFACCGTFLVLAGDAKTPKDPTNLVEYITPLTIMEAIDLMCEEGVELLYFS
jgi:predicted peroxiredoxin